LLARGARWTGPEFKKFYTPNRGVARERTAPCPPPAALALPLFSLLPEGERAFYRANEEALAGWPAGFPKVR